MKVAITGSTGFVWNYLVHSFAQKWWNVIAFWRKENYNFILPNVEYVKWDITQRIDMSLLPEKIDVLIHSASLTDWKKPIGELLRHNKESIKNVLEVAHISSHCIVISTSSVYQWLEWWDINENSIIHLDNLKNGYALSKYLAELDFIDWISNDIKLSILRPRAIYGKGDRNLIPEILNASFFNRLPLFWSGENRTSITHIWNLFHAIIFLMEFQKNNIEVFNIADPDCTTMKRVYELLQIKFWKKWIIHLPEKILFLLEQCNERIFWYLRDVFFREKVLNTDKIKNLWFKPKHFSIEKVLGEEYE